MNKTIKCSILCYNSFLIRGAGCLTKRPDLVFRAYGNPSTKRNFVSDKKGKKIDMKEEVGTKCEEACQVALSEIKKYNCESSIGHSYDRLWTQSYLEKIFQKDGSYLEELSLSESCDSSIIPFVGDHCKNLTTLECKFSINSLTNDADDFVRALTQLDKLKFIKIIVDYDNCKYDETINLFEIINSLPEEINEIHIHSKSWCWKNRPVLLSLEKFKNLQKLTLHGLYLDEIILEEISKKTTLVHLNIGLNDKHIGFPLFDKLVNLEYIQITVETEPLKDKSDENPSSKELDTIISTCKNLKHLNVAPYFYRVDKTPLIKWANLKNLEYLSLFFDEISLDVASTIVKYCKNLKYLCIELPSFYFIKANIVKKLTELENLESLTINSKRFAVSEKSIIAISNNCKKLKRLELDWCRIRPAGIDDELSSPPVLNELSKLQYLEHLTLENVRHIDDSTIIAIANNCKNLKSLNLYGLESYPTEKALLSLTNMENLQKLNVSFLDISNSFIIRLKGLKELYCSSCEKLTNAGVIQFIKNNPDLEMIDVCFIDNITIDLVIAVDQITKNRTNGIILRIKTNKKSIVEASQSIIKSHWLVIFGTYFCE